MVTSGGTDRLALLVVGGGAAGLSAARSYREQGGRGRVVIVSADADPPYERPALSKEFLRGDRDESDLPEEDGSFYARTEIGLRLSTPVDRLDPLRRVVTLGSGEELRYEVCLLATGSEPQPVPVPGGDHPDVLLLRSLDDARRLARAAASALRAVVIGSGFIGCEAAASLAMRGVRVQMITSEELPQLERLGHNVGQRIASWLDRLDVEIVTGAEVERVEAGNRVHAGGRSFDADLVLAATGVRPRTGLPGTVGLEIDHDRVVVDEHMVTSTDGVLAAGDVAYAWNVPAGRRIEVEHWGDALEMGRVAGTVAAGGTAAWDSAPGFWSTIGAETIKYTSWGDGFDRCRLVDHRAGGFTAWYEAQGTVVGVLTHDRDEDYERGRELVEQGEPLPG